VRTDLESTTFLVVYITFLSCFYLFPILHFVDFCGLPRIFFFNSSHQGLGLAAVCCCTAPRIPGFCRFLQLGYTAHLCVLHSIYTSPFATQHYITALGFPFWGLRFWHLIPSIRYTYTMMLLMFHKNGLRGKARLRRNYRLYQSWRDTHTL
jgi:hypothetical protein